MIADVYKDAATFVRDSYLEDREHLEKMRGFVKDMSVNAYTCPCEIYVIQLKEAETG